ncbi:MAG TPA: hypothetical protein VI997_12280 [Candidatus Thermoplasmatota archaeon]|nr:hypothetical protein [Candidatus Thermoplasmatota archaeon]
MTARVQFREDEATVAFVASLGLNPNEVAREAFEREVRRLRMRRKWEKLRSLDIRLTGSVVDDIREMRDSR